MKPIPVPCLIIKFSKQGDLYRAKIIDCNELKCHQPMQIVVDKDNIMYLLSDNKHRIIYLFKHEQYEALYYTKGVSPNMVKSIQIANESIKKVTLQWRNIDIVCDANSEVLRSF